MSRQYPYVRVEGESNLFKSRKVHRGTSIFAFLSSFNVKSYPCYRAVVICTTTASFTFAVFFLIFTEAGVKAGGICAL